MSFSTYTNTGGSVTTFTYPAITDTAIGELTVDTLQNKTITSGVTGNIVTANQIATSGTPVSITGSSTGPAQTLVSVNATTATWSSALDTLIFGTGKDGDVTITGTTVTLTDDMYYNDLTIDASGVLATAGFRVFVKGTATINGRLHNDGNGNAAPGRTAGTATVTGTVGAGAAGGDGGNAGTAGTAGSAVAANTRMGGTGGNGGTGASGANAGGTGGTTGTPALIDGGFRSWFDVFCATRGQNVSGTKLNGGCGGGGGGASNFAIGGGGGGGGGVVTLIANTVSGTGTISANGGVGSGGGTGSGGNTGGGGGGGGGAVIVVCNAITMNLANITASGGAGGATGGGAGGTVGAVGGAGNTFILTP